MCGRYAEPVHSSLSQSEYPTFVTRRNENSIVAARLTDEMAQDSTFRLLVFAERQSLCWRQKRAVCTDKHETCQRVLAGTPRQPLSATRVTQRRHQVTKRTDAGKCVGCGMRRLVLFKPQIIWGFLSGCIHAGNDLHHPGIKIAQHLSGQLVATRVLSQVQRKPSDMK